jgi:hypothetical protein
LGLARLYRMKGNAGLCCHSHREAQPSGLRWCDGEGLLGSCSYLSQYDPIQRNSYRRDNHENRIWGGRSRVWAPARPCLPGFQLRRGRQKVVLHGLDEGSAAHGETRMTNRAGKGVAQARRHLSGWPCRRIKTAEDCSALLHLRRLTLLRMALQSQFLLTGLEVFLPLGISPWLWARSD